MFPFTSTMYIQTKIVNMYDKISILCNRTKEDKRSEGRPRKRLIYAILLGKKSQK